MRGKCCLSKLPTAAGLKYLGIDPADVEEATGFVDASNPMVPNYGLTLKFVQPKSGLKLPKELRGHTQPDKLNGKSYLKSQQAQSLPSFYTPDRSTLVIAPDQTLRKLVSKIHRKTRPARSSTVFTKSLAVTTYMWRSILQRYVR